MRGYTPHVKKVTALLATSAILSALVDVIHGQHNGDVHRTYIHAVELVSILLLLSAFTLQAHRKLTGKPGLSGWAAALCLTFALLISGFAMFGLSGGRVPGAGGPIAVAFGIIGCIGMLGLPVCLIGWLVALLIRRSPRLGC